MKRSTLLSATFAAATLAGLALSSSATAMPTAERGYVERSVPDSPNGKDVFRHTVRVPKAGRLAAAGDTCSCPMMAKTVPPAHPAPPQLPPQ